MENNYDTPLDQLMDGVENALDLCTAYCDTEINASMKKPLKLLINRYELYVALKKAEEIYYENIERFEHCSFEPVSFAKFYQLLDEPTKKLLKGKIPEDIINEF